MEAKYFLLALMVCYCQNTASSHILTKAHVDLPLQTCIKFLASTVMKDLCPIYDDLASELYSDMELARREQWEIKQRIIKKCCSTPCTLNELILVCS